MSSARWRNVREGEWRKTLLDDAEGCKKHDVRVYALTPGAVVWASSALGGWGTGRVPYDSEDPAAQKRAVHEGKARAEQWVREYAAQVLCSLGAAP